MKKIIAFCLCLGLMFAFTTGTTHAEDSDPGQTPAPACSSPMCWDIV